VTDLDFPIDEAWLRAAGFMWQQGERQPAKHWLLWLGQALAEQEGGFCSLEDLGLEVAPVGAGSGAWFCWLRSDAASRYGRFIHTRHMRTRLEIVRLVEALTNVAWTPHRHVHGICHGPKGYERAKEWAQRLDVQMMVERPVWHDFERDEHAAAANASTLQDLARFKDGNV